MNHNPQILALLESGPFSIDWAYAMEAWSTYMEEMAAIEAGVPYAELGISTRRHAGLPGIITIDASGRPQVVQDPDMLRDAAMTPEGSFAHIRLQGVMRSQDGMSSRGVQSVMDDINAANGNGNIEGILLEVNTGGGMATAGWMMHSAVSTSPKPVVVLGHLVASAGYMASMGAAEIIASSPSAQFGSIGTMMTLPKTFAAKYNAVFEDIYASKSTNKNAAFRAFLQGNLSLLRNELEATNEEFLNAVMEYRALKGSERTIEHTLSGAMFDAKTASRRGLVDGIGGMDYAIKRLMAAVAQRKN